MTNVNQAKKQNQFLAAGIATGASIALGLSFGWSSPIESKILANENGTCSYAFCVTTQEISWIATSMTLGSLVAIPFTGWLMTTFGRKRALAVSFIFAVCGWLILTFAANTSMLYWGRVLCGAGNGIATPLLPVYLGEIAETSIRGTLSSLQQVNVTAAIMVTYILGFFFDYFMQNLISTIIVAIFACGLFLIPESPSYFAYTNQMEDAAKSLRWLRGKQYDIEKELAEIVEFQSLQESTGFCAFFKEKVNRRALTVAFGLFIGFEISGQTPILFYTAKIFGEAQLKINPDFATIFVGLFAALGTILSLFLVDVIGRRILLITSYAAMSLSFVIMGLYFRVQETDPEEIENWRILPVCMLCFYMFVNAIGCSPVAFVMVGEIFAQNVKDIAASLTLGLDFVFAIGVGLLFPFISEMIGSAGAFFIFAVFNAAALIFVLFVVPETNGKTFTEIQNLLLERKIK